MRAPLTHHLRKRRSVQLSIESEMDEIAQLFIDESVEGLEIMESGLLNLDLGAADPETMNAIFRAAHSIKGGGATFGFTHISEFAHHVETLLDEMRQGERAVTQEGVDLLLQSTDCISEMISGLAEGNNDTTTADALEVKLEAMLNNTEAVGEDPDSSTSATRGAESGTPKGWQIQFKPHQSALTSNNDPLRILAELQRLGEMHVSCLGGDTLFFGASDPKESHLSWNIELHGEIEREQIDEVFTWIVDECDLSIVPIEDETAADPDEPAQPNMDKVAEPATQATPEPKKKPAKPANSGSQESSSIRVNIDKVDALINLVGELVITQSMLSRFNGEFDFTQLEGLRDGLTQLSRNTRELQESVMAIRMMPISVAFSRFPRLVRDTGNAIGKKVELRLSGEATELDKTVLEKIGDPLVHLVRNSLDHGLELPEVRAAAGKSETGVLELNAYHEGGNIVIEVIDDGAGINKERVLAKARERGLVAPDEQLSDERINNLIFMAGFSTADEVSDLSGRGVGMDVVRRNIRDLNGHVSVHSETGVGSVFTIKLPLTLAILDGQLVRVGEQSFIVPLVSIVETIQASQQTLNEMPDGSEVFHLRDDYLSILRLHQLFGVANACTDVQEGLLVVAEANGQRIGILVDDLLEQQQVVIKSLEANYQQTPGISGATILGDGSVALIVDIAGLMQLHSSRKERHRLTAA